MRGTWKLLRGMLINPALRHRLIRGSTFELLESRMMLSTHTWTGAASALWSDNGNWTGGSPVGDASADLVFPTGAANLTTQNDLTDLININSITFSGNGYNITGNQLLLLGNITADSNVTGTVTYSAPIQLSSNPKTFNVANASGTLVMSGVVSGAARSTKTGPGTLDLTAANTFTGDTSITGGILNLQNNSALGNALNEADVFAGAAIQLQSGITLANSFGLNSNGIAGGGAIENASGTNTLTGEVFLDSSDAAIGADGSSHLNLNGDLTGVGGFTKLGTGTVALGGSQADDFQGAATVSAGTLLLSKTANVNAIPGPLTIGGGAGAALVQLTQSNQIPSSSTVTIDSNGMLDLNGFNDTLGGLNLTAGTITTGAGVLGLNGNVTANGAAATSTISGNLDLGANTSTFDVESGTAPVGLLVSAVITGTGGINKTGPGLLELTGNNPYSGTTTISAGTLEITGSQANSAINLLGGSLINTGTTGPVTSTGGVIDPAGPSATGILNTGNLTLSAGSTVSLELDGTTAGTGYDQINVAGTVNLNNAALEAVLNFNPSFGTAFTVINNDGSDPVVGTFAGLAQGAIYVTPNGEGLQVSYTGGTGNDVTLTHVTIPLKLTNVLVNPAAVNEGSSATITGNVHDDNVGATVNLTINWGDGSTPVTLPITLDGSGNGVIPANTSHTYAGLVPNGNASVQNNITLTLNDVTNSLTAQSTTGITVNNVAPTVTNLSITSVDVGGNSTLTGDVNDPGTLDTHTIMINWGDGSTLTTLPLAAGVTAINATHSWLNTGSFTVTVVAVDSNNAVGTGTIGEVVANAELAATAASLPAATRGTALTNQALATFTDSANINGSFSQYSATVNWGDSTSSAGVITALGGGFQVTGSHTYLAPGQFTVGVVINDTDGATASTSGPITVNDAAITVTEPANLAAGEPLRVGATLAFANVVVASFTDSAFEPDVDYTATINWGDGTSTSAGTLNDVVVSGVTTRIDVTGSHIYALPGQYTVAVTVSDTGGASGSANTPAHVGTLAERFVQLLFQDLLHRNADPGGLVYLTGLLNNGSTPTALVEQLVGSQEYKSQRVEDTYNDLLGRGADPAGLASAVSFLQSGGTVEQLAIQLATSSEFFTKSGGTNTGFVDALYTDALGRPADAGAATFITGLTNGTLTTTQVATSIIYSTEYLENVVASFYTKFLDRTADAGGKAYYAGLLQNGTLKDEDVIARLIDSHEYFTNRLGATGTPNEAFVGQLFTDILNRPIDPTGLAYYSTSLTPGASSHPLTRSQVILNIEISPEYHFDLVQSYYQKYLGRTGSSNEISYWSTQIDAGARAEDIIKALVGSAEFASKNGGTNNTTFVAAVYQDLLNRSADAGAAAFVNQLNAGTLTQQNFVNTIVDSLEFSEDTVNGFFNKLLHRTVDASGEAYYSAQIQAKVHDENIVAEIIGSAEYFGDVLD